MTKEQLNELSIYALRNVARKTGVEAPTSKKKEQLVNEILLIMEGKLSPHVAKSRQGRPPKNTGFPFAEAYGFGVDHSGFSNYLSFNQMQSDFVYDDMTTVLGYVDIDSNGATGVLFKDKDKYLRYILPTSLIDEYNLKTGDLVLVEIAEQGVVKTIYEINGNLAKNFKAKDRKDFNDIKHVSISRVLSFKKDKFNKLNMKKGEIIYIYGSDNSNNTKMCVDLANSCDIARKIYINASITDKNISLLDELNQSVEVFTSKLLDEKKMTQFIVSLAGNRARRIVENGEDVVIIVDDIRTISALDTDEKNVTKTMLTLARDSKDSGSITIIAVMDKSPTLEVYEKLADKRFKIEDNELVSM
ncbi:MAG TPA: hypothetical protein IAB72_00535 [Candidatus Onthoplasma faecipullorum]|nr:hypothetical protein [Candidatus Onthoplasma faecipullorum]